MRSLAADSKAHDCCNAMEQNVTKFGAPPAASLKRPVRNSVTFKDDGLLPMRSAMMPLVVAPTINPTDAARTAYST